jgi:hypothetical protein
VYRSQEWNCARAPGTAASQVRKEWSFIFIESVRGSVRPVAASNNFRDKQFPKERFASSGSTSYSGDKQE